MNDWTITETYTLPSKGKIYATAVNPKITLRSMTTGDEMSRLSNNTNTYKSMCDLIDRCIISEYPGISSYDMCIADYQFLLFKLRTVTYGSDYKMNCNCPLCKIPTIETINLDNLSVKDDIESFTQELEFELPRSKKHIKLNYHTPRLLDIIDEEIKEFKKKTNGKVDKSFSITLKHLIKEVDGIVPNVIDLEQFCENMPLLDANYILKKANKADSYIGFDLNLDIECEVCGHEYRTQFRHSSEFFGPSID